MAGFAHPLPTNSQLIPMSFRARPSSASTLARLKAAIGRFRGRVRERRTLAELNERELRDIGLSSWDVHTELAKPFWRG